MSIGPIGFSKGRLRAEPNGPAFNAWVGPATRTYCSKDEAIKFLEDNTTANEKADKDAVVNWLKNQP